jgi:hypothetical protein
MTITQIRVGRTYNTLNYTSHRFELEADIDEDEDVELAVSVLANDLDSMAKRILFLLGITRILEPGGETLLALPVARSKAADDDIPF